MSCLVTNLQMHILKVIVYLIENDEMDMILLHLFGMIVFVSTTRPFLVIKIEVHLFRFRTNPDHVRANIGHRHYHHCHHCHLRYGLRISHGVKIKFLCLGSTGLEDMMRMYGFGWNVILSLSRCCKGTTRVCICGWIIFALFFFWHKRIKTNTIYKNKHRYQNYTGNIRRSRNRCK